MSILISGDSPLENSFLKKIKEKFNIKKEETTNAAIIKQVSPAVILTSNKHLLPKMRINSEEELNNIDLKEVLKKENIETIEKLDDKIIQLEKEINKKEEIKEIEINKYDNEEEEIKRLIATLDIANIDLPNPFNDLEGSFKSNLVEQLNAAVSDGKINKAFWENISSVSSGALTDLKTIMSGVASGDITGSNILELEDKTF